MSEQNNINRPTRRTILTGTASCTGLLLAGCLPSQRDGSTTTQLSPAHFNKFYGARPQEQFPLPAIKQSRVKPKFYRREVDYKSNQRPGTVVVETQEFYLYLVGKNGRAMRYGVGLGRAGFEWSGKGKIAWKRKWPTWTPPAEMIERDPRLARWSAAKGGMKPGLKNPLGARALYIYQNGKDTLYRLHGTPDARSIGKATSSGCVRLINQDVIDLYERVKPGARIVVV